MYAVSWPAMAVSEGKASLEYLQKLFKTLFPPLLVGILILAPNGFFTKNENVSFKSLEGRKYFSLLNENQIILLQKPSRCIV